MRISDWSSDVGSSDLGEGGALDGRRHELGDALAARDLEWFGAQVGKNDLYLAPIIAVDRAGRVEAGDAVFQGEARTGSYLHFIAMWDRDGEAGRYRVARAGRESQLLRGHHVRSEAHPSDLRTLMRK